MTVADLQRNLGLSPRDAAFVRARLARPDDPTDDVNSDDESDAGGNKGRSRGDGEARAETSMDNSETAFASAAVLGSSGDTVPETTNTHALDVAVSAAMAHVLDDGTAGTNRCMMLCYASGRPKHRRYFYVRKTGVIVWARSARSDKRNAGFHRGRIVGVLPSAPVVAEKHRDQSFVISTEDCDRQLIIIANSTRERDLYVLFLRASPVVACLSSCCSFRSDIVAVTVNLSNDSHGC